MLCSNFGQNSGILSFKWFSQVATIKCRDNASIWFRPISSKSCPVYHQSFFHLKLYRQDTDSVLNSPPISRNITWTICNIFDSLPYCILLQTFKFDSEVIAFSCFVVKWERLYSFNDFNIWLQGRSRESVNICLQIRILTIFLSTQLMIQTCCGTVGFEVLTPKTMKCSISWVINGLQSGKSQAMLQINM